VKTRQATLLRDIHEFSRQAREQGERSTLIDAMDGIYQRLCAQFSEEELALRVMRHPSLQEHSAEHTRLRAEIASEMRVFAQGSEIPVACAAHVFDSFVVHLVTSAADALEPVRSSAAYARTAMLAARPSGRFGRGATAGRTVQARSTTHAIATSDCEVV